MRLLLLVLVPLAASAQAPLVTDRPDFTESAVAVPSGSAQVEAGLTLSDDDVLVVSGPEALVRVGIASGAEGRLGLPDYVALDGDGGLADPSVGVKVELGRAAGWGLAAIAEVSLPLGEDGFGTESASPLVLLIAGRDVGAYSVGTQGEVAWGLDAERVDVGGTLVVGRGLGARSGTFVEGAVGTVVDGPLAVLLHHGYTLLLTPTLQLDGRVGAGLTDSAPDLFGGVGLSVRFGG